MAMLFLLLGVAVADLPVHCLRHHVEGAWRLHLGKLGPERTQCGHEAPDAEAAQPNRTAFIQQNASGTFEVLLGAPSVAHVIEAGKPAGNGTWTMVYDEGFFLEAAGKQFFAFNHFTRSDPESVKDYFPAHVHGKKVYRSVCGQTEVGWYQDQASGHWGCFVGERSDLANPGEYHDFMSFLNVPEDPTYHLALTQEDHERKAARLNEDLTKQGAQWEAAAYPQFAGKSVADLNRQAGPAAYSQTRVGKEKSFMSLVRRTAEVPAEQVATKDTAFRSKYPQAVDWRDVNGTNWLTSVTDQGDCGSCYVVSSQNMLTAMKKIDAKDHTMPPLSISLPLYCSDLNQGCQGGYPFLNALWGQGVGLVDEGCMDHYHVEDGEQCPAFIHHEMKKKKPDSCMKGKEHKVHDFGYVGGFYGGCSEEGMMAALQNGPITIAVEPGMDFMYYKKGVYSSVQKDAASPVADEWYKVDHAILMVGYGVDETGPTPKPYWTLQNSWGADWGEDGFMRIARGENESGIEFQAVMASVTSTGAAAPIHAFLKQW